MSANVKIALIIAFATIVWLGSGLVSKGGQAEVGLPASSLTKVSVEQFTAQKFIPQLRLNSHTAANRVVELKAQVAGTVKQCRRNAAPWSKRAKLCVS